MPHRWKVVPISEGQLMDVRKSDLLNGGLFRKCSTYRGGGGYDKFPKIACKRFGGEESDYNEQFIIQIFGCNLDCPYCYVTRAGVWGNFELVDTVSLVKYFLESKQKVLHLMGGAPALQLKFWPELMNELEELDNNYIFHSDFMLTENVYDKKILREISHHKRALFALNIKGLTEVEYFENTRKKLDVDLFWENWRKIENENINYYVTFTACDEKNLNGFLERLRYEGLDYTKCLKDSFNIELIEYNALPYVDKASWGAQI